MPGPTLPPAVPLRQGSYSGSKPVRFRVEISPRSPAGVGRVALPCGADCRTVREENPSRGNLPVRLVLVDVSLRGGDGFVGSLPTPAREKYF